MRREAVSMLAAAAMLGVALIVAAFLSGGRYATTANGIFIYDRFTGDVRRCYDSGCRIVSDMPDFSSQSTGAR